MRHLSTFALLFLTACSVRSDEPTIIAPKLGWIGSLTFLSEGDYLALGTADSKVCLWDMKKGSIAATSASIDGSAITALHWRPDSFSLFAGTQAGARRVVKVTDARLLQEGFKDMKTLRGSVHAMLSLNADEIVSGGMEGVIRIEKMRDGRQILLKGHTSWVNGLVYLDHLKLLASAGSDNTVRLWDMGMFKQAAVFTVKEGEVRSVALSPDGKYVAAGIRYGWVRVWERETKKEVVVLKAHEGEMGAIAFTPDGKTLVSGGGDWNKPGEVRLIDTANWKVRTTLKHTGEVLCMAISPDGKWLAAGSWDRTVRLWDLTKVR